MKGRKTRNTGGVNSAESDLDSKPQRYNNAPKIQDAASERKNGGRTKKMVGGPAGAAPAANAGRAPRKSGGRTGCDSNPFSSARNGTVPAGRKLDTEMD